MFGVFCALRVLSDALFLSEPVCVAVRVFDEEALASLEILLEEAQSVLPAGTRRRGSIVVLYDDRLLGADGAPSSAARALLERFGAVCYIIHHTES